MIVVQSQAEASKAKTRFTTAGGEVRVWITSYLGAYAIAAGAKPEDGKIYPVAYLIEQDAGTTGDAHYHLADEFQLFLRGNGTLNGKAVRPISLHYADSYAPYGPIEAGSEGLAYLTLRNGWDPGPLFISNEKERERLRQYRKKGRARQARVDAVAPVAEQEMGELAEPRCETLVAPTSDNMAAWLYRIPPNTWFGGPPLHGCGGQFWVVLSGGFSTAEIPADAWCLFVSPDERPIDIGSGPAGLQILALQFPAAEAETQTSSHGG